MSTVPIEREEWLILLGMVADIRARLTDLTEALADEDGDDDEGGFENA